MANTTVTTPEPAWAAFLALDWGSQKHAWILQPADGGKRNEGYVDNTPEAIAVWAAGLHQRFGGRPVAVALEQLSLIHIFYGGTRLSQPPARD